MCKNEKEHDRFFMVFADLFHAGLPVISAINYRTELSVSHCDEQKPKFEISFRRCIKLASDFSRRKMVKKQVILQLAIVTITLMPAVALIIDHYSDTVDLATLLVGFVPWWQQVAIGLVAGGIIAVLARLIVSSRLLNHVNLQYAGMLGGFNLNMGEIILISLCAGVGEELLFRGAIQPLLGVFITSVIFVAVHGYLNPSNWRLSVYGIFMTAAISLLGIICNSYGLIAPIIAHTVIDVYLLYYLQKTAVEHNLKPEDILIQDDDEPHDLY